MESSDSPEIPDKRQTSDIPGLPSEMLFKLDLCQGLGLNASVSTRLGLQTLPPRLSCSGLRAPVHHHALLHDRQTLTSPLDSVSCLIEIWRALFSSDTRQCPTVESKSVTAAVCHCTSDCPNTVPDSGSERLGLQTLPSRLGCSDLRVTVSSRVDGFRCLQLPPHLFLGSTGTSHNLDSLP